MGEQERPALAVGQTWQRGRLTRRITHLGMGVGYTTRTGGTCWCELRDMKSWCAKATLLGREAIVYRVEEK